MPKLYTKYSTSSATLNLFLKDLFDLLDTALMFNIDRTYSRPTPQEVESLQKTGTRSVKYGIVKRLLQSDLEKKFQDLLHIRDEMSELEKLLQDLRPIKLSGLTGTGKTVCLRVAIDNWKLIANDQKASATAVVIDVKGKVSALGHRIDDPEYSAGDLSRHVNAMIIDSLLRSCGNRVANRLLSYIWTAQRQIALNAGIDSRHAQEPEQINRDLWDALIESVKYSGIQAVKLLEVLKTDGERLCLAFDNVDRLIYEVQRKLYTIAIDYSNEVNIAVIFACRDADLQRSPLSGIKGDVIYPIHLSAGSGINDIESEISFETSQYEDTPELSHLTDDQLSELIVRRVQFVLRQPYIIEYLKSYHIHQTEHNGMDRPDDIEARAWMVVNNAMPIWIKEYNVLTYFNGGIRESAAILTTALFRILLEVDRGFEYNNLFSRAYLSQQQIAGRIGSHFMNCLCTGSSVIPSTLKIFNVFESPVRGFLTTAASVQYGMLKRWDSSNFSVQDISLLWLGFGLVEFDCREVISELATSRFNGPHGFLMGSSLEFDAYNINRSDPCLQLLPGASVMFQKYVYKTEYLFWALFYRDWPESEHIRLAKLNIVTQSHSDIVIRLDDKVRFVVNALEVLYVGDFREELLRLNTVEPNWREHKWLGPFIFRKMIRSFLRFITELSQEGIEGFSNRTQELLTKVDADLDQK